jgi:uroporphyrinogen-III synthase
MRVLVTRAPEDAARTGARIEKRGHEAVLAPVLTVVPTGEPLPAGAWAAALLTSAHAVPALAALPARGPVFAVGTRTGEAAREAGLGPVREAGGDAASLAALIRATLTPPATLLHATGRHRKPEPETSLRDAGYAIVTWETYEARPVRTFSEGGAQALRTGKVDVALHYSRRSAELFLRLAEEAGLIAHARTISHLCLSADVASPLAGRGLRTAVAPEPGEDALLTLLDRIGALPP